MQIGHIENCFGNIILVKVLRFYYSKIFDNLRIRYLSYFSLYNVNKTNNRTPTRKQQILTRSNFQDDTLLASQ